MPERSAEYLCVLGVVLAAALWSHHIQQYHIFRIADSDEYYTMAEQFAANVTVTASAPYAYRVLTPWIVARCCPQDIQHGFLVVNVIAGALGAVLLTMWLARYVPDPRIRVLVTAAYVWEWHQPVRFVYYYPAYVEPLFLVCLPLGLFFVERVVDDPSALNVAMLIAISTVGTLAREIMVFVPMLALWHRRLRARGRAPAVAFGAALAAGLAAWLFAHRGTNPRAVFPFSVTVPYQLQHKPLFTLFLAWFITFGPILAIVGYDWRNAWSLLRRERHLGGFLLVCMVLAYVGGHDTERYLAWAAPVVYAVIGRAIIRHREALSSVGLVATLLVAQLVSEHVFWAIPSPSNAVAAFTESPTPAAMLYAALNRLFVIDDFNGNLWSDFGSPQFHLALLGLYGAVSALVVVWMHQRTRRNG